MCVKGALKECARVIPEVQPSQDICGIFLRKSSATLSIYLRFSGVVSLDLGALSSRKDT